MKCRQGDNMGKKTQSTGEMGGLAGASRPAENSFVCPPSMMVLNGPGCTNIGVFFLVSSIASKRIPRRAGGGMRGQTPSSELEEMVWGQCCGEKKGSIPPGGLMIAPPFFMGNPGLSHTSGGIRWTHELV